MKKVITFYLLIYLSTALSAQVFGPSCDDLMTTKAEAILDWEGTFERGFPSDFIVSEDGSIVLAGGRTPNDIDLMNKSRLVKFDSTGQITWEQFTNIEAVSNLEEFPSGDFLLLAKNLEGQGFNILKTDVQGNELWSKLLYNQETVFTGAVDINDQSEIFIGASTTSALTGPEFGQADALVMKLDSAGNLLWTARTGGLGDEQTDFLLATPDGGVLTARYYDTGGGTNPNAIGNDDILIQKFTDEGILSWQKAYGSSATDQLYGIESLSNGNYIVLAISGNNFFNINAVINGGDRILIEMDNDGNELNVTNLGEGRLFRYFLTSDKQLIIPFVENFAPVTYDLYDSAFEFQYNFEIKSRFNFSLSSRFGQNQSGDLYRFENNSNNNFGRRKFFIQKIKTVLPQQDLLLVDNILCKGSEITLDLDSSIVNSLVWEDGSTETSRTITLDSDTIIGFTALSDQGCAFTNQSYIKANNIELEFEIVDTYCGLDQGEINIAPINDYLEPYILIYGQDTLFDYGQLTQLSAGPISFKIKDDYCEASYDFTIGTDQKLVQSQVRQIIDPSINSRLRDVIVKPDQSYYALNNTTIFSVDQDLTLTPVLSDQEDLKKGILFSQDSFLLLKARDSLVLYDEHWQLVKALGLAGIDDHPLNSISDIQATSTQEYILAGTANNENINIEGSYGNTDAWVTKLDQNLNTIWSKNFGGSLQEYFNRIFPLPDGGIMAVGASRSDDQDLSGIGKGDWDIWVVRLDAYGTIIWSKTYGGSNMEFFIAAELQGEVLHVLSRTPSNDFDLSDQPKSDYRKAWYFKIDLDGTIIFNKKEPDNSPIEDYRNLAFVDDNIVLLYDPPHLGAIFNVVEIQTSEGVVIDRRWNPYFTYDIFPTVKQNFLINRTSFFEGPPLFLEMINYVLSPTRPSLTLPQDTIICVGDSLDLDLVISDEQLFYEWSDGNTDPNRLITTPGLYELNTYYAPDCPASDEIFVDFCTYSTLPSDTTQCGDFYLDNNLPGLSYEWSTGDSTSATLIQESGWAVVTITNARGDVLIDSTLVNYIPNDLNSQTNTEDEVCVDTDNGWIELNLDGGTLPYLINWNDGSTEEIRTNLAGGSSYAVTVSDINNCLWMDSFNIAAYPNLTLNATIIEPECFGDATGAIEIAIDQGSQPPYQYTWNDGTMTPFIQNIQSDVYTLAIEDANGCVYDYEYLLIEPDSLYFTANTTNPSDGMNDGSIFVNFFGGTSPYTIDWVSHPMLTGNQLFNLAADAYEMVITDANGCSLTNTFYLGVVDINEVNQYQKITLAPNPTNDIVTITFDNVVPQGVQVFNSLGQLVLTKALINTPEQVQLSMNDLPPGTYHFSFNLGKEVLIRKIVKLSD